MKLIMANYSSLATTMNSILTRLDPQLKTPMSMLMYAQNISPLIRALSIELVGMANLVIPGGFSLAMIGGKPSNLVNDLRSVIDTAERGQLDQNQLALLPMMPREDSTYEANVLWRRFVDELAQLDPTSSNDPLGRAIFFWH